MQLSNAGKNGLDTVYVRFAPMLFMYLSRQVVNHHDTEDLLFEVFLSASKEAMLEAWPEESQLTWLRRVARNKVIDYYRHRGLIQWLPLVQANEVEDTHLTPEEQAQRQEEYAHLFQAIQRLKPVQQELLRLRYGHELRFTEIAGMLEKPEGSVRKMLTRTMRQLRKYYEHFERGGQ